MIARAIRQCATRFNEASRPVLVSDGREWWVEDSPNHVRMPPVGSEEAAEDLWTTVVDAARPKLQAVKFNQSEGDRAPVSH